MTQRTRPTAFVLLMLSALGCASATPTATPESTPTVGPSATSTTPAPSGGPTRSPSPTPTESPAVVSPLDGIWASSRVTHEMAAATLENAGFDEATVDAAATSGNYTDYQIFELEFVNGFLVQSNYVDGVPAGIQWDEKFELVGDSTVVTHDTVGECGFTLDVDLVDDQLAIDVVEEECADEGKIQDTLAYESSTFHRVTGEGAPAPVLAFPPTPEPGATPVPSPALKSSDRLVVHPAGTVDGAPLGYAEYLPPSYDTGSPAPLLVFLHGSGESGTGDEEDLDKLVRAALPGLINFDRWPDERPFVVLAPQHNATQSSFCFTPEEIDAFLTFAVGHYAVDPARVYLTGLSCGAIGGWNYLGAHTNEVVAAAVLIAGDGYGAVDEAGCNLGHVPLWAFHGGSDDVVPARLSIYPMAFLQACTAPAPVDARLTVYPEALHDAWTKTYNLAAHIDIYSWLLEHTRQP